MARYFCTLAYNGANYNGWQIQPNAPSVQETLEKAFSTLLRESISVTGCGRTDTGVHAKYYVMHFDTSTSIENPDQLCFKLNSFLPKDIVLFQISLVNDEAHARFNATDRAYEYHIILKKDPFKEGLAAKINFVPDFDKMNEAAKYVLEIEDFTSFSKLHTDVKTNNCDVRRAEWIQASENHWVFHVSANRFLRNMVRAMVGTLLDVGKGKLSIQEFQEILQKKDRGAAGTSAPAHGLYLSNIVYPFTF